VCFFVFGFFLNVELEVLDWMRVLDFFDVVGIEFDGDLILYV